jgi:succinoglycan biosynthesis transport protein ExoP
MSLADVFRLLARKWLLLLLVPVVFSVSTYFFARNLPKTYASDTTIYTGIASGYSLSGNAEADYNKTSNAFDNLINLVTARSTKEEVAYHLLATHLWQTSQQPALLATPAYAALREGFTSGVRKQLTGPSEEATLENVRRYAKANTSNEVYNLLNSGNPTYSLTALGHLTAVRIGSSDLVRLEFESHDPELCRYTLELATRVFLEQSKNLREGQTVSVVDFYENEVKRAKDRLAKAEAENLAFNREHNIINYDEQSKNVASEKEALASELTQVSQQYAGAKAALDAVNKRLGGRGTALLSSTQVLEQRQKLGRLNAALADQQLFNRQQEGGESTANAKQLQAEADKTAQDIQKSMDKYYTHSNSVEGIPSKELLGEWVQSMVLAESNKAKLTVMKRRLQEFEREYQRMAPLGAELTRIQREIDLSEKAYLSALTSLNSSKASQQNTQLTSNLKIVDAPNLPTNPKTSKLVLLVLLSGMGGFVFTGGLVLGLGLMDRSLRNPVMAARQIGLPVAGIMLDTQAAPTKQLQASRQRSLDQLVRHILLKANTSAESGPFVVGIFSVQREEGKTTLCQALAQRCHEMGVQTLALYPDHDDIDEALSAPSLFYPSEAAAVQGWRLDQLIQNAIPKRMTSVSAPDVQIMLVDFPAMREEALPVGVLRQLNLVFLTVPATRPWRLTDHQSVESLRAATKAPVEVVLSGVSAHDGAAAVG